MKYLSSLLIILICISTSLQAQNWYTDLDKAKEIASEQNREIILVFQGSDWCAPCIKLDRQIWSSEEFIAYSKDHFVLVKADFPRKKANRLEAERQEKNNQLAEKYNSQGFFPLVVVMDKEGQVLGKTGYKDMSPSNYIQHLLSF